MSYIFIMPFKDPKSSVYNMRANTKNYRITKYLAFCLKRFN